MDEAGRGSWAGPLVAAAVVLPLDAPSRLRRLRDVRDSKALPPDRRAELFGAIWRMSTAIGVGWVGNVEIDRIGLGEANRVALQRAVENVGGQVDGLVIDHFRLLRCPLPQVCVSGADALSLSVASASIVAKVLRDRWMQAVSSLYPGYGFELHKGYGTRRHRDALDRLGACELHRFSFAPLARNET